MTISDLMKQLEKSKDQMSSNKKKNSVIVLYLTPTKIIMALQVSLVPFTLLLKLFLIKLPAKPTFPLIMHQKGLVVAHLEQ